MDFSRDSFVCLTSHSPTFAKRPLSACHPRDLLEQILDYCRYYQLAPRLTPENIDRACHSYFVA